MPNMESTSPEFKFDGRHFNIESSIFLPPITETELQAFLQTGVCNTKFKVGDQFHAQKPASELPRHLEIISDLIPSPGTKFLSTSTRPSPPSSESPKSSGSLKKKEERKLSVAQPRYRERQRMNRISKELGEKIGNTQSPVSQLLHDSVLETKQAQMSAKCEEFLGTPYVIPSTIEELEQVRKMCKYEQDAVDAIAKITSDLESEGPKLDRSLNMNLEIKEEAIADILKSKTPISLINEEACLSISENDPLKKLDFVYDLSEKFHQGSLWGLFAVSFQMNEAHQFAAHTREDMKQEFSEFGEVARVNIAKDVDGKRGFTVWFAEEKAAKNAIQNLRHVYHGIRLKNNANTLLKSFNNGRSIELNASLCFNNKLGIPIDEISEEWKKFGDVEVLNLATSKRSKNSRPEVYICFKNAVEMNAAMQHFIFKDEKYPDLDLATSSIGAKNLGGKADLISKEVGEMIGKIIKQIEASMDAGNDVTELCNVKEKNQMETPKGKWLKDPLSRNGGKKFTTKQLNCSKDTIPRPPPNTPSTSVEQITGIKSLSSLNDSKVEETRKRNCDDKDPTSISPIATSTPVPSTKDIHTYNSQTKLETVKENEIFVNSDRSVDMKSSLVQVDQTTEDGSSFPQKSVEVDVPTLLEIEISNSLNAERSEIARRELIQITKMLEQSQTGVDGHSVNPPINEEEVGQQLTPIPSPSINPHPFFAFPSPGAEAKMLLPLATASEHQVKPESLLSPTLKKAQLNIHLNAEKGDIQQNTPVSSPLPKNGNVDSIESHDESGSLFHPKAASDSVTRTDLSRSPISGGHLPLDKKDLELSPVVSPIHPLPKLDSKTDSSGGCCFSFGSPFSPLVSSPKSRNEVPPASPNISIFKTNLDSTSLSIISLNDEMPTSEALDDQKSYHTDHNSNMEKSSTSEIIGLRAETTPPILPDIFGRYGLVMCGFGTGTNAQIEEIREDFEFFGDVVSLAWRTNACIVKFADMEPAKAAFVGLREKYKHLRPFQPVDIGPDRLGRFTVTFLDTKGKKYVGTKEEFFKYGEKPPLIAKGEGKFLIRVSYSDRKGALDAFISNVSNPDFPELQIAPECEISPLYGEEDSQGTLGSQNSSCLSTTHETSNEDFQFVLKYETEPILCYQNVFDSHCHIDLMFKKLKKQINWSNFKSNRPDCYNQNWSGCITVMCDPSTWSKNLHILLEPDVWAVVGCHPKLAAWFTADKLVEMRNLIEVNEKIRAVGEIGLDAGHEDRCKFEDQEKTFRKCLEMAVEMDKPICLHVKGRMEEARQIMREVGVKKNHKIHFHCWGRTDNWEVCQDLLCEYPNLKVGITPLVTFTSAANVHDVATRLPLDRMLLETDSPYFYPRLADRKSQTRCSHPGLVIHAASQVALLKGISVEDVLAANRKNVEAVYGI